MYQGLALRVDQFEDEVLAEPGEPSTSQPAAALTGGSNVLSALIAATSIGATRRPGCCRQRLGVRCTSAARARPWGSHDPPGTRNPVLPRGRLRPSVRGRPSPRMKETPGGFHEHCRQTSTTYA